MAIIALVSTFVAAPLTAFADSGFFLGGSVGAATLDDDIDAFAIDTDSTSFRINAGWQFSDFFAIEAGYHDFGKFDEELDFGGVLSDVNLRADGYTLGAIAGIPLGSNLSLI
ncbi:MAG: outer membrane beta-barrel protein, partial [Alphaproteobacteria bacterium]|nr:outer membrane beta-barrel protein [Alphaproteobacteria bacterium]